MMQYMPIADKFIPDTNALGRYDFILIIHSHILCVCNFYGISRFSANAVHSKPRLKDAFVTTHTGIQKKGSRHNNALPTLSMFIGDDYLL